MSPRLFNKTGQIWLNFWGKFTLRFGKIRFRRKILMEGPSFYNEVFRKNWCYFCTSYIASFLQKVKNCTLIDDGRLKCYDFRMVYAHFMHKKCFKIRFIKAKVAEKIRHFQITFFKSIKLSMKYNRYFGMLIVSETAFMQHVWKIRHQTLFGFMLKCLWWQRSNEVIILKNFLQRSKFLAVFSRHKNFILKKRRKTNVMQFWKTVTKTDKLVVEKKTLVH